MMQAKDVIERARIILQDAGADYWDQSELPKWLSDGRMEAYTLRPDLYEKTETVTLNEGTKQSLPNDSRRLFSVIRNVSHAGQRYITVVDAALLARSRPTWRSQPKSKEIIHYIYNDIRGNEFEVYPPAREDVEVEISYAKMPAAISSYSSTQELKEEGEHAQALIDYVLYRAFQKEADTVPAFHDRAMQHYGMFQSALAGSIAAKAATSPNQE